MGLKLRTYYASNKQLIISVKGANKESAESRKCVLKIEQHKKEWVNDFASFENNQKFKK
jgi:hypothetical protein